MQQDSDDEDRRRLYHRYYTCLLTLMAAISLASAFWGYQRARYVDDLYHLINPGDRPNKGEGTIQYLFSFPGMLVLATIANWVAPGYMLRRSPQSEPGFAVAMMVALALACVFVTATLMRVHAVSLLVG
ncbi:hypothetical protein FF100_18915 [Methylobacterium terricola]|uniref:Uncharacterized protein n=1 Tax=Methylobacterium terricola TaxID=2583531 RepID=A0A5C4LH17_9HYPH|nr:hypothetical protein [Methylobacterium terricola]TNC11709.1 hypothetical protein FF100_18915 [Methylobacterium terricola]